MLRALLLTLACQSASPSSPAAGLSEPLSRLPAAPPWTWQGAGGDVYHSSATPAGVPLPSASTAGATVAARLAPFAPESAAPLYAPALSARLVDGSGCAVLAQAAPAPCQLVFLDAHGALLYQWPTEQHAFPLAAAPTLDPKGRCVLRDARVRKRDWVCARLWLSGFSFFKRHCSRSARLCARAQLRHFRHRRQHGVGARRAGGVQRRAIMAGVRPAHCASSARIGDE